jgi:hypothetical protein
VLAFVLVVFGSAIRRRARGRHRVE